MNMNKVIYILTLLITITSCSDKQDKKNFVMILGEENVETLDYLVESFENEYLKITYPEKDIESAYNVFIEQILKGAINYDDISKKLKKSMELYSNSRLLYEKLKLVDSVWVLDSLNDKITLKMRYKFIDSTSQFNYSYDKKEWSLKSESLDSIFYKSSHTVRSNYQGKYLKAIKVLKNRSLFFKRYNNIIDAVGSSDYLLTADLMKRRNVDYNDYFIKRVVVLDLVY